jgi:hypothetical protein
MLKYKIEGDVDFFEELYKSLDDNEVSETSTDFVSNNLCLITDQPLVDKFVQLPCGHKFNYLPLYKDILNHKKKFNIMESTGTKLSANEMRCPYCRIKHTTLLPFYEEFNTGKVYGVNTLELAYKPKNSGYSGNYNPCSYKIPNISFDSTKPESDTNLQFKACGTCYSSTIYIHNNKNPNEPITYGDNNLYCYSHKKLMIKTYKIQLKQKSIDEAKKAKDEAKKAKDEAKQKEKDDKKAEKAEKEAKKAALVKTKQSEKKNKNSENAENVVIGTIQLINSQLYVDNEKGCIEILKSGSKKGSPCDCKIFSENYCKRHYNIIHGKK